LFETEDMRELATLVSQRQNDAPVEIVDAAYWKKGCSSLGLLRYAVLLRIGSKSDDREHCLMDLKEAVAAQSPHKPAGDMPRDHAERVLAGARRLSPFLGARMRAVRLMGKPLFVRELLPQDLKIEIERLERDEAKGVAGYLAAVVGKAHAHDVGPPAKDRSRYFAAHRADPVQRHAHERARSAQTRKNDRGHRQVAAVAHRTHLCARGIRGPLE
jgi:uncharacterized protein (DUF2252 family)